MNKINFRGEYSAEKAMGINRINVLDVTNYKGPRPTK